MSRRSKDSFVIASSGRMLPLFGRVNGIIMEDVASIPGRGSFMIFVSVYEVGRKAGDEVLVPLSNELSWGVDGALVGWEGRDVSVSLIGSSNEFAV